MSLLSKLAGGDRRSIGNVDEVVTEVMEKPALFGELIEGMVHDDPLVRMRAADAAEKIAGVYPEYLQPFKTRLIEEVARSEQQEVRWHVAQMFSYLDITAAEQEEILIILMRYLQDDSKIVKTNAMQALADLAERDERLRPRVLPLLEELVVSGSPAMVSRGMKLLSKLKGS